MLSNELKLLRNAPLGFLKNNSVDASNAYSSNWVNNAAVNPIIATQVYVGDKRATQVDTLQTISHLEHKVAYGKLRAQSSTRYFLDFYNGAQLSAPQKAELLPMWFLPWWADHVTKMRILPSDQMPDGQPNPSIFFTSALTGCSIFVKGPANSPTVYHAGSDSNRDLVAKPMNPNSILHWQNLFNAYSPNTPNRGEANKGQYLATDLVDSPDLQVYVNYLKGTYGQKITITSAQSTGSVFGVRAQGTGAWTFYLQEKATITFQTFTTKKKYLGLKETITAHSKTLDRPMVVREIFPNGDGAKMWNTQPVSI